MPDTIPLPFKQRFKGGFRVYDSSNVRDRHVLTLSSRKSERSRPSAHVKFIKAPGMLSVTARGIVFGSRSKRIVDKEISFDLIEILTACDLPRWRDCTNDAFAEKQGAAVGLADKYIRVDKDLILLFKNEEGKIIEVCIRLTKDLRGRLYLFFQTDIANP